MQKTSIEYLSHTWNPIAMRCTRCSPGCDRCWHLRTADRLKNNPAIPWNEQYAMAGTGAFVLRERELSAPSRAKKPAVIGVQFMGDLFHGDVPGSFVQAAYTTMAQARQHTFLVLTKRARRMADILTGMEEVGVTLREGFLGGNLPNIYHGLTVCNQAEADEKIPVFLQVPGRKFLSIEPMSGPIDLRNVNYKEHRPSPSSLISHRTSLDALAGHNVKYGDGWCVQNDWTGKIDAVIVGGETGPGARPLHPEWIRSIRDQCEAAGVPFFFKSWGRHIPDDQKSISTINANRFLDGRTHNDLPWVTP